MSGHVATMQICIASDGCVPKIRLRSFHNPLGHCDGCRVRSYGWHNTRQELERCSGRLFQQTRPGGQSWRLGPLGFPQGRNGRGMRIAARAGPPEGPAAPAGKAGAQDDGGPALEGPLASPGAGPAETQASLGTTGTPAAAEKKSTAEKKSAVKSEPYVFYDKYDKRQVLEGVPQPRPTFSKKDRKRIKAEGPKVTDLFATDTFTVGEGEGKVKQLDWRFIPPEVVGEAFVEEEPKWDKLESLPIQQFIHGLRQRNWTSEFYDPAAVPWRIEMYQDAGRLLRPSWPGFRALVTEPSGRTFWVDMPDAGNETFTRDYLSGGTIGANWRTPRVPTDNVTLSQYGYNQVLEQMFQAYEQKLPRKAMRQFDREFWVDPAKFKYECPGEEKMKLMFKTTPSEPSLYYFYREIPTLFFYVFAFSFLVVCLGIGIFRPRKQMPNDPQQAMEFAQSKGQARKEGRTNVRFTDVAGITPILAELEDVVKF
eukprot:jgi/Botrbrau1/4754/Bobra.0137s0026.1